MKLQHDDPTSVNYQDLFPKANHRAPLVVIAGTAPIPGADRIEQVVVHNYESFSFVSQKGQFTIGDLAVFIQPDSIVPEHDAFSFVYADYAGKYPGQPVPEKYRRITVRRYKKVWSEGLLVPLQDFGLAPARNSDGRSVISVCDVSDSGVENQQVFLVGDDLSGFLGIKHYDPETTLAGSPGERFDDAFVPRHAKRRPQSLRGWFHYLLHLLHIKRNKKFVRGPQLNIPVYDVDNLKNYPKTFAEGEIVLVTEKIHGSNARFVYVNGVLYAGSRTQWVDPNGESYPAQALRANPWIAEWCANWPGHVMYGEVTPRQKGFDYGSKNPKDIKFWLFDVLSPDGHWFFPYFLSDACHSVPVLYWGPYDKEVVLKLVDGPSSVEGASHIREGIVIRGDDSIYYPTLHKQLKLVSNAFLEKDTKLSKE